MHKKLILYICILFLAQRCAQITPLTGGKKDTTAPKPLAFNPENESLNFTSKTIEITFDEFITLKDVMNQFIITPQTNSMPDIESSGKKLKIKFSEQLLENTTYKLSFGNSIVDIHEGTAIENFEYIFSTGSMIDSFKLDGIVLNSINKAPQDKILIGLYEANAIDSVIYKNKPLYIGKTTTDGKFSFKNLPNKEFKLIALMDNNKNLMYDGSEEQLAYLDINVKPSSIDSNKHTLYLFKEIPSKRFIKKSISTEYGKALIIYNKEQTKLKSLKGNGIYEYQANNTNDSIAVYYNNVYDTLLVYPIYENGIADTVIIKIPSKATLDKTNALKRPIYSISNNLKKGFDYFETPQIQLNFPINENDIDKSKMVLYEFKDTVKIKKEFEVILNKYSKTSFFIKTELLPEHSYQLDIYKNALNNKNNNRTNDSINFKFETTSKDDYAQLTLKLFFPKKENYILMLYDEKGQLIKKNIIEFSLTSSSEKNILISNLIPGNYFLRVVEDVNKNNVFDTGDYFKKKQPETIFINSTPIKLLAGWEIENEWKIK